MKVYNTFTATKEEFIPINENRVSMYVCGPTVYNYMHIGNARTFVIFDTIARYLRYKGYNVTLVRNYTDVDDRIIKKANEENTSISDISARYIAAVEEDETVLNIITPDYTPKVTHEIPAIITMIEKLVDKGYAYVSDGSVFYDTEKFSDYGKLSKKNIDELIAGARVEVNEEKRNPMDFVLWKPAKENEPGWDSPWGNGRPGWHIECSAMAKKYLGDTIDIHAGGEDLIFPHHENEIAQSEAANGCLFAKYWLHAKHLHIDNRKMAKSAGNFFTVRDISARFPSPVIRYFLLASHYRSTLNFSEDLLVASENAYNRINTCVRNLDYLAQNRDGKTTEQNDCEAASRLSGLKADFEKAMDDDFNTADAIAVIFELVRYANKTSENASCCLLLSLKDTIVELCGILGINIPLTNNNENDDMINALIEERQAAKKAKDFVKADEIRDRLLSNGIIIEDTRQGVRWSRA